VRDVGQSSDQSGVGVLKENHAKTGRVPAVRPNGVLIADRIYLVKRRTNSLIRQNVPGDPSFTGPKATQAGGGHAGW